MKPTNSHPQAVQLGPVLLREIESSAGRRWFCDDDADDVLCREVGLMCQACLHLAAAQ